MRVQDFISSKLYFPVLFPRISTAAQPARRIPQLVREKERLMRASLQEIAADKANRVHRLLVYAARHCEFYRERFASVGLKRERDLVLENLVLVPLLTKKDIQDNWESLLASGVDRGTWLQNASGGSTGQTVVLMQDPEYREEATATAFVSDRMQGWDFGKRLALLWGGPGDAQKIRQWKGRILSYMSNRRLYDSFDMSAERMASYHRGLGEFRPDVLQAYAASAYVFALFLGEMRLRPTYPRTSIICSAETLTAEMRRTIEDCFDVPVYNRYGSREVGCIGTECACRTGLHLHLDKHLEVLDAVSGSSVCERPGNVVVTLLSGRAMPLIRYELGDIGILSNERCGCGIHTPLIRKIIGRSSDFILASSGRMIHGEFFTHLFYGRRNIRQFQFVQHSSTSYTLRIVRNGQVDADEMQTILRQILDVVGREAEVEFSFVDRIAPLPSGKFRFTVSEMHHQGVA